MKFGNNVGKKKYLSLYLNNNTSLHSKKMLGCFNPILGQIWTNSNIGLKM